MKHKHIRRIGRRLKSVTICPLIIGILLCSILSLSILYSHLSSWISEVKEVLESREKDHLLKLSEMRSQIYSSSIYNNYQEINFLTQLYSNILSGKIKKSENFTSIEKVELNEYIENSENYNESVVMMAPYNRLDFSSLENSEEIDLFLAFLHSYNKGTTKQTGIVLDNGYEFRYFGGNMSYIAQADPCGTGIYDSRCLNVYNCKNCEVSPDFWMYFEYNLTFMMKGSNFSIITFENETFFDTSDEELDDYFYFLSDNSTQNVFHSNKNPVTSTFGENISVILDSQDYEISSKLESELLLSIASEKNSFKVEGYNEDYLVSYKKVVFETNDSTNLICITGINENLAMKQLSKFLDKIYKIGSIQVAIFLIFIALALSVSFIIASSITTRITTPLIIIESYLKGKSKSIPTKKYNKEVNDIIKYLRIINTIEELLDPRFLLHPNKAQRIENLVKVCELFVAIKNNRGVAITKNLIGNLYLEEEDFERAVDMYRESLAEMEALYNEVTAQEHAETKLSFEERKMLKLKSGKDTQNWDDEKAALIYNITERIQQLYLAKQMALEFNLETAHEIRAEWKAILDLQTRALQNYISFSNNYVNMLKVILDISYVYHKLQYFHTALELLDVVYEELTKLSPDLTEQAKINAKGVTIDIDITRLKRLSLKVKDNDGRKLYFQVSGVSFEKDILRQTVLYRRALIYKDNERFQEAALYFTMSLEQGSWYDPEIRKLSISNLFHIYSKFKLIHDEALLLNMYEKSTMKKNSVIFGLCYEINLETSLNELIVDFVSDEIQSQNENFGVLTENIDGKFWMDCAERDYPGLDIENLISTNVEINRHHVYDVILRALQLFPENSAGNTLVLICKKMNNLLGPGRLDDIEEYLENVNLAVVALDSSLPFEFEEYLKFRQNSYVFASIDPKRSLDMLKKSLFS